MAAVPPHRVVVVPRGRIPSVVTVFGRKEITEDRHCIPPAEISLVGDTRQGRNGMASRGKKTDYLPGMRVSGGHRRKRSRPGAVGPAGYGRRPVQRQPVRDGMDVRSHLVEARDDAPGFVHGDLVLRTGVGVLHAVGLPARALEAGSGMGGDRHLRRGSWGPNSPTVMAPPPSGATEIQSLCRLAPFEARYSDTMGWRASRCRRCSSRRRGPDRRPDFNGPTTVGRHASQPRSPGEGPHQPRASGPRVHRERVRIRRNASGDGAGSRFSAFSRPPVVGRRADRALRKANHRPRGRSSGASARPVRERFPVRA